MIPYVLIVLGVAAYVAHRTKKVPSPQLRWKRFEEKGTAPLDALSCKELEGIYSVKEGVSLLGPSLVLKWSYTEENKKMQYHLSFFGSREGSYCVLEGRRRGNEVLLSGYWRSLDRRTTGTVRLLQEGSTFRGFYGEGEELPTHALHLDFEQPLPHKKPLAIIGHRGGARNVDFLPVSENSLEMLRMAARLGATGVEIDVRLTKEGIPILFHDSFLSAHTIRGTIYAGAVENHTLAQLRQKELLKGGRVPTLREALYVLLYQTPIETVWLDIKYTGDQREVLALQQEFLHKSRELGRDMKIYLGIPDKKVLKHFLQLPHTTKIPMLSELEEEETIELNAQAWAPQYTEGTQREDVASMQAQGIKVFVWSLDDPAMVSTYLEEGGFDGVVTNAPPVVAYQYYMNSIKALA